MTFGPFMFYEPRWCCKLGRHPWITATSLFGQRQQVCRYCRVVKPGSGEGRA